MIQQLQYFLRHSIVEVRLVLRSRYPNEYLIICGLLLNINWINNASILLHLFIIINNKFFGLKVFPLFSGVWWGVLWLLCWHFLICFFLPCCSFLVCCYFFRCSFLMGFCILRFFLSVFFLALYIRYIIINILLINILNK